MSEADRKQHDADWQFPPKGVRQDLAAAYAAFEVSNYPLSDIDIAYV